MTAKFPITRGFVIQNILRCFAEEGGDGKLACPSVGLSPPESIAADDVVAAERYHALLEQMVEQIGDPCFVARVGRNLARQGVTALVEARRASHTIGEFLVRCQILFKETQDSGWYILGCDGTRATFEIQRWPGFKSGFSKAETLNAAAWITIFSDEIGEGGLGELMAALPDPLAMPDDILPRRQCIRSKDGRMKLSFPAAWLVADLRGEWAVESVVLQGPKKDLGNRLGVEPIRQIISNAILRGEADLSTVSSSLGMSTRKLQRMLSSNGTGFSKLLSEERLRHACDLLRATQKTIGEIAEACGFSSSQALSKSFRAAFGIAPSEYRQWSSADG